MVVFPLQVRALDVERTEYDSLQVFDRGSASGRDCSGRLMGFTRGMGSHSGNPAPGEQRVPIEQALAGLEVHPLEEGETAIEAFVLVKALNAEGEATWAYRTTNRLNREELLGALTVQVAILTKEMRDEWDDD
jgi:hypothetical protein